MKHRTVAAHLPPRYLDKLEAVKEQLRQERPGEYVSDADVIRHFLDRSIPDSFTYRRTG